MAGVCRSGSIEDVLLFVGSDTPLFSEWEIRARDTYHGKTHTERVCVRERNHWSRFFPLPLLLLCLVYYLLIMVLMMMQRLLSTARNGLDAFGIIWFVVGNMWLFGSDAEM